MARPCLKCGADLPSSKRSDALYCSKTCGRSHYWERNKDRLREYQSEWRNNNRDLYRATARRYAEKNKEKVRADHRLSKYGLSEDEYALLVDKQGNRCAICRSADFGSKRVSSWHVDHDHDTDKVRGLLCSKCNTVLGLFEDDPTRLKAAIEYLWDPDEAPKSYPLWGVAV